MNNVGLSEEDPSFTMYKAQENKSIGSSTSYTIKPLLHAISKSDSQSRSNLRKKKKRRKN